MSLPVTILLRKWASGDETARDQAIEILHGELVRLAARYLRGERPAHTLQPAALVNEAYLRLVGLSEQDWRSRAQFLSVASQLVLVDSARKYRSAKRGGGSATLSLDESVQAGEDPRATDVLALNLALDQLQRASPRTAKIMELHFFGGLTVPEVCQVLEISEATAMRDLRMGKAWLHQIMHNPEGRNGTGFGS